MVLSVHRQDGALSMVRSHLEHGDTVHQAYNHIQVKYIETVFGERFASGFFYLDAKTILGCPQLKMTNIQISLKQPAQCGVASLYR